MRVENAGIGMVEACSLHPAAQKRIGLSHEELVECVVACHHDRQPARTAAGAPPLLPQRGDRSRKADGDGTVEKADVDAELERVRGGDAEELSVDEPLLDPAPLLRCVARAVGSEPPRRLGVDALDREAVDQLGRLAALRKTDRTQATRDEPGHQQRGFAERAGALSELGIEQRGIPQSDVALGRR